MKRSLESAGLYTIDPLHGSLPSPARARSPGYDALVTIVALGGTSAFLAEDLARLFSVHFGWRVRLTLVDHDVVEEHNEQRQAFSKPDRGRHKAQVVGERSRVVVSRRLGPAWCAWTKRLAGLLLRSRQVVLIVGSAASKQKEQGAGIRARAIVANH